MLPPWNFDGVHFTDGGPLTVQYLLLLDALNFCFWPDPSLHYEHLASGLRAAVHRDPTSIDAARIAALDVAGLRALLGPKPFPLEQQRVQAARQVGQVLLRRFSGSAASMVEEAGGSAEMLVRLLTTHFPYFQDHAIYRGRQVALFKRAQIFVADVWGAFNGRGLGRFSDSHRLTMFADYVVPAVLRSRGVLRYAPGLAAAVDGKQEILPGSEEEVEIRACCIVATERLRERLERTVGKQVLSIEISAVIEIEQEDILTTPHEPPKTILEKLEEMDDVGVPHKVWLSDVVTVKKRPYFFNREWLPKDIGYAAFLGSIHLLALAAPFTFSWEAFECFVAMYVITGMFGITLSFHRHLTHHSFVLPKWLEYTFAYCGVLACQGPPFEWIRNAVTDLSCVVTLQLEGKNNIYDLTKDPFYQFIDKTYVWHIVASVAALYALGGFPFVVWGWALRLVWVYHITWFVNSASHVWGDQPWNTGDLSRNNWWVGILAFGEGWHNNHHAFEYSARHGLEWWQIDMTWYTLKLLEAVGLATNLRYPREKHMKKLAYPDSPLAKS
ncbi:unnamed protein product [Closterium sp. Naga37s-1]|nr:unnamed protein product [Closterium sp. Naga37s-1]